MGIITVAGGVLLFSWYRIVAALPAARQLSFIRSPPAKWGIPAASLVLLFVGLALMALRSRATAIAAAGAALLAGALIIRFDRYSALMRTIHHRYRELRRANPRMEEIEALFLAARSRYPDWNEDRLVELVAGKNIRELLVLIVIRENDIHPL
ncbi:MAG: hypothetical protein FJW35_02290, partial [Acidobacteria bacterium]|nr:hypothetical protein [Acidobacteriota bacterium]